LKIVAQLKLWYATEIRRMKKVDSKFILHPFLFAMYIVLAPMAENIYDVGIGGIRALLIAVAGSFVIVIFFRLIFKNQFRASLISSGFIILVFSYGHLTGMVERWELGKPAFSQAVILLIWATLFSLWTYWILSRLDRPTLLTGYLNLVSLILIVFPIYQILTYSHKSSIFESSASEYQQKTWQDNGLAEIQSELSPQNTESLPDIYYIILDAYTRADVLEELYGYDNSEFLDFLRERGFYIAESSKANYPDTVFSLSSSLNMMHINTVPEYIQQLAGKSDFETMKDAASVLLKNNRVSLFLRNQGYTIVSFDSGYDKTRIKSSDQYVRSPDIRESNVQATFEFMLLNTTVGDFYQQISGDESVPMQSLFDDHRARILFTFQELPEFAARDGNYFVFAHILSPHTPYVFGPNGEERRGVDPYTLLEKDMEEHWDPGLYRDQVIFINKLVMNTIDQILQNSDTPPIIILQADHSSRAYRQSDVDDELKEKLLFPILNAYYLPGADRSLLYPQITPVNSFRAVLSDYFGSDLSLLDDTSYRFKTVNGNLRFVPADQGSAQGPE
jgi:hypothetical protein